MGFWRAAERLGWPSKVGSSPEAVSSIANTLARGYLNMSAMQFNLDWILPYWAVKQYEFGGKSFIPRANNSISINCTHRNWTAIGLTDSEREPIVDPRGLLTPWYMGWSIDFWARRGESWLIPSRAEDSEVGQYLVDNMPIVVTEVRGKGILLRSEAYVARVSGEELVFIRTHLRNESSGPASITFYYSIRPYNPEGLSLIKSIIYRDGAFFVNDKLGAILQEQPNRVICGNLRSGDVFLNSDGNDQVLESTCEAGLCTASAEYSVELRPGEGRSFEIRATTLPKELPRSGGKDGGISVREIREHQYDEARGEVYALWFERLNEGMSLSVPDERINRTFLANKAHLLLLVDRDFITSGPSTYHNEHFRTEAYSLTALDKLGFSREVTRIVRNYPKRQRSDGCFLSRDRGWDSNGQAIWTIWNHYLYTGDEAILRRTYPAIRRGVEWLRKIRGESMEDEDKRCVHYGLLPPGTSAGHLGPSDYYYWDNFWALAGIDASAKIANVLGDLRRASDYRELWNEFYESVELSIQRMEDRFGRPIIPSSPHRRLDSGVVYSLAALYPLQLMLPMDKRISNTLAFIKDRCFYKGGYRHDIVHSGLNVYMTAEVAQCHIFRREVEDVHRLVKWILDVATPTYTYPEAIHPSTGGGCMGDGQSGWASAEIIHLFRNMLLYEAEDMLILTPALPPEWIREGKKISLRNAATHFGIVGFELRVPKSRLAVLNLNMNFRIPPSRIELNFPFPIKNILVNGREFIIDLMEEGEKVYSVFIPKDAKEITIKF
ncbi:MAG: hypothetical protein ACUVXI_17345 [bacterium]